MKKVTENTAELINIKEETLAVEGKIKTKLLNMTRKSKIDFERPNDYGQRNLQFIVVFDQLNIDAFNDENIKELRELYARFTQLRRQQIGVEKQYDINRKVSGEIKSSQNQHRRKCPNCSGIQH